MEQPRFPMHRPPMAPFMSGKPTPAMGMSLQRPNHKVPEIFYYNFEDAKSEKKWRNSKEDITDYFNYGMNEDTWKIHAEKVIKLSEKVDRFASDHTECVVVNDRLPLEFGGFGAPYFEKIRNFPFFSIMKKNKERFYYQQQFEPLELRNQLQNALGGDNVEENYKEVKACYDAIVPDTLTLRHKLPSATYSQPFSRLPGLSKPYLGTGIGGGRPPMGLNRDPMIPGLGMKQPFSKPYEQKAPLSAPYTAPTNYGGTDAKAIMNNGLSSLMPHFNVTEQKTIRTVKEENGPKLTPSLDSRKSKSPDVRRDESRESSRQRERSRKRDKKRRSPPTSSETELKKRKPERRRDSPEREERRKKEKKDKRKDDSRRKRSRDRSGSPKERHRKDNIQLASKKDPSSSDIRMRIQPRNK